MNIVITGASRGIGYHMCLHFAKDQSNKIFALSRSESGLRRLKEAGGDGIIPVICDISNEGNLNQSIDLISEKAKGIEILINNAGKLVNKPFLELRMADWNEVFNVNVFAVFNLTKLLLPLLKSGDISDDKKIRSHIINISSIGGIQGSVKFKGLSAYSSSKGAVITMTECLAEELKEWGIRVNCIALGSVETEMFQDAFPGLKASSNPQETASWIAKFATQGCRLFNGKTIPLSSSTP